MVRHLRHAVDEWPHDHVVDVREHLVLKLHWLLNRKEAKRA